MQDCVHARNLISAVRHRQGIKGKLWRCMHEKTEGLAEETAHATRSFSLPQPRDGHRSLFDLGGPHRFRPWISRRQFSVSGGLDPSHDARPHSSVQSKIDVVMDAGRTPWPSSTLHEVSCSN